MKSLVLLALALCISYAHGYGATLVGPGTPGAKLKGPAASATLIGPDGSHISAGADSGAVIAPPRPGGVISASVSPGYAAYSAPAYAGYAAPAPWAYAAPLAYAAAPAYGAHGLAGGAILSGPSGIVTSAGPVYAGYGYGH